MVAAAASQSQQWLTEKADRVVELAREKGAVDKVSNGAGDAPQVIFVDPQDVLMAETVRERHLQRCREGGAGSVQQEDGACRLLAKLYDVRLASERSSGPTGSVEKLGVARVDLTRLQAAIDGLVTEQFARYDAMKKHGLVPMAVIMSQRGILSVAQLALLNGLLERGARGICVLSGGCDALAQFMRETRGVERKQRNPGFPIAPPVPSLAQSVQSVQADAGALIRAGAGGLRALWDGARVDVQKSQRGKAKTASSTKACPTFTRAPAPPNTLFVASEESQEQFGEATPTLTGQSGSASH